MRRTIAVTLLFAAAGLLPAVGQAQTDTVTYYHTDAIGSVRMVTDATGQVLARYDYQPFGLLLDQTPPPPAEQRQFGGKERDPETSFDYFGGRYYQSLTGRFTTVDPVLDVEQALVDPQRWNRYAYVRNTPFRYVDPDGRAIETLWDVFSFGVSLQAVRQDPTSVWNWVSLGADAAALVVPGIPAVGMAVRSGNGVDNALDVAKTAVHAGSGPARGVLELSRGFKSSRAIQNYAGQGAEFVFDSRSGRFVMGSMKHSTLVKNAGIEAGSTTVGGIISRQGNRLVTNERSGTYGLNWTPEIRKRFRDFLEEHGVSAQHIEW